MLVVCAAVIHRDDKVLIAQRKKGSHLEMYWEFPGGKLEEGESPEECIKREIMEELNIEISVVRVFDVIYHKYEDKGIVLIVYECRYIDGEAEPVECNDFKWVNIEEIADFNLAPADITVSGRLFKVYSGKL